MISSSIQDQCRHHIAKRTLEMLHLGQGNSMEASRHLEESVTFFTEKLGTDHDETLLAIRCLAKAMVQQGLFKEALNILSAVLSQAEL